MKTPYAAALSFFFSSWIAYAETPHAYTLIGSKASNEDIEFIDVDTIQRQPDGATAWLLLYNAQPIKFAGKSVEYGIYQFHYSCTGRTVQVLYGGAYSLDGDSVATNDVPEDPSPVVPESLEEAAIDLICAGVNPFPQLPIFHEQLKALEFARELSEHLTRDKAMSIQELTPITK